MTIYNHVLHGCAPVPLAGYLKAFGVFRLVAEQVDPAAAGFWRDERFILRTVLAEDELVRFFVDEFKPTPVVAPWNNGSGFWPKDNKDNKAEFKAIKAIRTSNDPRLSAYNDAIRICERIICTRGFSEIPKDEKRRRQMKAALIGALRASLSEEACRWLDGALALTADGLRFPPILGTGGNDGRLDFSNNFMRHVTEIIGNETREPRESLICSLFYAPCAHLEKGAVGQFYPGQAGGLNAGVGFEADSRINPWDFVFTIEGALVFAAAAARRHAADGKAALAFPFTTLTVGAGSGAAAIPDEAGSRNEFWAPLWSRATHLEEMLLLMSEGRAVVDGGSARNGLDFARAVGQLGVARGIHAFQRYGFLERAGKAYFATPLGRVRVRENPCSSLISELDRGGWLSRARKIVRDKNAPSSLRAGGRSLDEALFRLAGDGSTEAVQQALIAVGALMAKVGRRPRLRKDLPPPPRLSRKWVRAADDESHEYALAAALASLTSLNGKSESFRLPFRRHLAPLDWPKGRESWSDTTESRALVVWGGRSLIRDMGLVLKRRLIKARGHGFVGDDNQAELPLHGWRSASLAAVAAFLAGRTDDTRIGALAVGLAWTTVSQAERSSVIECEDALPFAYAALKPLFAPEGVGPATEQKKLLDPLVLVRLIEAGRVADAVTCAQAMARGAGLSAPYARRAPAQALNPARLAAALVFPIAPKARERLVACAYPNLTRNEENDDNAA